MPQTLRERAEETGNRVDEGYIVHLFGDAWRDAWEPKLRRSMAKAKKLTRQMFCIVYGARVIVLQEERDRVSAMLGQC